MKQHPICGNCVYCKSEGWPRYSNCHRKVTPPIERDLVTGETSLTGRLDLKNERSGYSLFFFGGENCGLETKLFWLAAFPFRALLAFLALVFEFNLTGFTKCGKEGRFYVGRNNNNKDEY